jgi:hypothetical protein
MYSDGKKQCMCIYADLASRLSGTVILRKMVLCYSKLGGVGHHHLIYGTMHDASILSTLYQYSLFLFPS